MGGCYRSLRMGRECAPSGRWVVLKVVCGIAWMRVGAGGSIFFAESVEASLVRVIRSGGVIDGWKAGTCRMRLLVNASALVYNRYMMLSCDLSSKNAVQELPASINSSLSEYPALTTRPR
jgi:hypothetical protein